MYRRSTFHTWGLAAATLFALSTSAVAQSEQKSAKDLIAGTWTLVIADNVRADGTKVPGFGPLPTGMATFGADGHYTLEVMPNANTHVASAGGPQATTQGQRTQGGFSHTGTYMLDETQKTLTFRVETSSLPNWQGTTQTGKIKFLNGDHLGWTSSMSLTGSGDFASAEFIWARSK